MTQRTLAAALAVTLLAGCTIVGERRAVVDTATVLGVVADQLSEASTLTYTARYSTAGGQSVTVVQQPPNVAFLATGRRLAVTREHLLRCEAGGCERAPRPERTDTVIGRVTGPGFVLPETALGLVAAAAFAPGARVALSSREIAGHEVGCAQVSGPREFTICLTDRGVLASFRGTLPTGESAAVELNSFTESADPSAFAAPAGATVREVTSLD